MNLTDGVCQCNRELFVYNEKKLECECENGYFREGNECLQCEHGCYSCLDDKNCLIPQAGFYINDGRTSLCHETCYQCYGNAPDACTSCYQDQNLVDGICVCPSGKYFHEGNCLNCTENCVECESSVTCITCSKNYNLGIDSKNCTLPASSSSNKIKTILKQSTSFLVYFSSIYTTVSASFTKSPSIVWTTINTVQLLCYIPLQNIPIPNTLYTFFRTLQPISLIPNIFEIYKILDCVHENQNSKFIKYGYKCTYFVTNTGEVIFAFGLSILYLIFVYILYLITCGKVKAFIARQLKKYKWSYIVRFWIEGYLDIAIPCLITLNNVRNIQLSVETSKDLINSTIGFVFAVFVGFSPFICWFFILHAELSFKDGEFILVEKYAAVFKEFKYKSGVKYLLYFPYFFFRRSLYALILYNFYDYPAMQVSFNVAHSLVTVLYVLKYQPYEEKKLNIINAIQEILVCVTFGLCGLFLLKLDSEVELILEFSIIGIVIAVILMTYLYSTLYMISEIKDFIGRYKKSIQNVNLVVTPVKLGFDPNNSIKSSRDFSGFEENKENYCFFKPFQTNRTPVNSLNKFEQLELEALQRYVFDSIKKSEKV